MPTFEFSNGGKTYEITGPEGSTQEQAFGMLQKQLSGQKEQAPEKEGMLSSLASGAGNEFHDVLDALKEFVSTPEGRQKMAQARATRNKQYEQSTSEHPIARKIGEYATDIAGAVPAIGAATAMLPEEAGLGLAAVAGAGGNAVSNMLTSPTGQAGTEDFAKQKLKQGLEGGALGAAGEVGGKMLSKFAKPAEDKIPPMMQRFSEIAKKYGIDITKGNQLPAEKGGKVARTLENTSHLGPKNQESAQKAIAKELGVNSNRLDERTLDVAYSQANDAYNRLTSGTPVKFDKEYFERLNAVLKEEKKTLPSLKNAQLENTVSQLRDLTTKSTGGKLGEVSPRAYQDLRNKLNDKAQEAYGRGEGGLGKKYKELIEEMDNSVARNIPPEQKAAWEDARKKWRNWSIIKEIGHKGGIKSGEGTVDLKKLSDHMRKENPDAFLKESRIGRGDTMLDIAKMADAFPESFQSTMKKPDGNGLLSSVAEMGKGAATKATGAVMRTPYAQSLVGGGSPLGSMIGSLAQKYPGLIPDVLKALGITSQPGKDRNNAPPEN